MVYRDLNMDDLQLKGCPCITKKVSKIVYNRPTNRLY